MSRTKYALLGAFVILGVLSLCGISAADLLGLAEAQEAKKKPEAKAKPRLPAHAIAMVGDDVVYADEVLGRIQGVELSRNTPAEKQLVGPAYEYVINVRILRKEAARLKITCTEADKKKETKDHIERLKVKVKQDYGGQISWTNYLRQRQITQKQLYQQIFDKSELIVLRRRLVNYWEMTTTGAQIIQYRGVSKKLADGVLAKIDSEIAKGDGVKQAINRNALHYSSSKNDVFVYAYEESPMPELLRKAVFKDLKVGKYSGILKVGPEDFRIVYLQAKHPRKPQPFSKLKNKIDEQGPVDKDDRYRRWINAVYRSGRYRVTFKLPGRKEITTANKNDIAKATSAKAPAKKE